MDTKKIAEHLVEAYTDPFVAATEIAGEIARLQGERLDELDEVGAKILRLGVEQARAEKGLETLLNRNPEAAKTALEIFRKAKLNTGELSSRTNDALETAYGAPVYPPGWPARRSRWAIVES
jgi:hypothetical protein